MKKIAILTLPLHINFGGNLQAYALQKKLKDLGFYVELINIKSKRRENKLNLAFHNFKQIIKQYFLKKDTNYKFSEKETVKISKNHQDFIEKYMKLTAPVFSIQLLNVFNKNQYDAIIVGSDQVWRKIYTPNIYHYFLDFIDNENVKKIAYAASFGVDFWEYNEEETKNIRKLAQKFDYISVREKSAVNLCEKYLQVCADHVIDPTLLLEKKDYLDLCKDIPSTNKGKILTYILDETPMKKEIIDEIAKKIDKQVFNIAVTKRKQSLIINDFNEFIVPSIETWLRAFDDADFIVTDSFHGMIFSLIFNKPFYAIVNSNRGASRFISISEKFNISDRIIFDSKIEEFSSSFDFSQINNLIQQQRKECISKLKNALDF